jgi:hypothetical protein
MKWLYPFLVLSLLEASAQDTIFLKSGFIITGKIESVGQKETAYRKAGKRKGLLYFEETQNIDYIRWHNGKIFSQADTAGDMPYTKYEYEEGQKITLRSNNLIYKNKKLYNFQLEELIKSHPDSSKRVPLLIAYGKMISCRRQKAIYTCISAVLSYAALNFAVVYLAEEIRLRGYLLATQGLAAGAGATFFIALRKRHTLRSVKKEIVGLY